MSTQTTASGGNTGGGAGTGSGNGSGSGSGSTNTGGGGGTHPKGYAPPLTADQRTDRYMRQNGAPRLTARQRRRVGQKARRAAVRGAA